MARFARSLRLALWMAPLIAPVWPAAMAAPQGLPAPEFSAEEVQRIASHGPWPPTLRPDPSNRVSGNPQAIELGRRLFSESRMSPVGYIGCVTCHQPDRSFTDNKPRAHGLGDLPRNTPALANLGLQRWFGWGGVSDSLWMASVRPILDHREFDSNPATVVRMFARAPELDACYRQVFRSSPHAQPQRTLINVGKALAAFQETLITARTPFDGFRDALARNDAGAAARYPAAAQRGLKLFIGEAGCAGCHSGPGFTDAKFHRGAAPDDGAPSDATDTGRLDDVRQLHASPLSLLGPYNDSPGSARSAATRELRADETLRGRFRTPGLRNVAHTAPYLHDGRVDRLHDALQHQRHAQNTAPLTNAQVDDLAAFLTSLSDAHGERRPWDTRGLTGCP